MRVEDKIKPIKDEWEELLNINLQNLQNCQQNQNLKSCFECEKLLNCKIRDRYVNSVYTSMNKGQEGGFEF
jgi:hypothetical protein